MNAVRNSSGSFSVPMALILILVSSSAWGMVSLQSKWRKLVETQLRLDACVGKTALEFSRKMNLIENSNIRMKVIRATLLPASLEPSARSALQVALQAEFLWQETQLKLWRLKQATWILKRGCDSKSDIALPLPLMPWIREPADFLGPRPLRRTKEHVKEFKIALSHLPRHAAAKVSSPNGDKSNVLYKTDNWRATWTSPL